MSAVIADMWKIGWKQGGNVTRSSAHLDNIGVKKMRRLAEDNAGCFAVFSGNRYLIIRTKFEKFVEECSAI